MPIDETKIKEIAEAHCPDQQMSGSEIEGLSRITAVIKAVVREALAEQPSAKASDTTVDPTVANAIISELGKLIVRYHGVQLGGIRELREELTRMRRELEHQHVPLKPPPGVYPATGPVPDLEEKEPKGLFGRFWDWLWAA